MVYLIFLFYALATLSGARNTIAGSDDYAATSGSLVTRACYLAVFVLMLSGMVIQTRGMLRISWFSCSLLAWLIVISLSVIFFPIDSPLPALYAYGIWAIAGLYAYQVTSVGSLTTKQLQICFSALAAVLIVRMFFLYSMAGGIQLSEIEISGKRLSVRSRIPAPLLRIT